MKNPKRDSVREREKKNTAISAKAAPSSPTRPAFRNPPHLAGMELLKLMMFKTDFLSNGKCDDRVPPINLSQLPEFLLCKLPPSPSPTPRPAIR